jgi:hypothetical protein
LANPFQLASTFEVYEYGNYLDREDEIRVRWNRWSFYHINIRNKSALWGCVNIWRPQND